MLEEMKEVKEEFDSSSLERLLADRYDPQVKITEGTFFLLIELDPIFLGNRFIQDRIKEWQHKAKLNKDDPANDKLIRIGKCLCPPIRPGQPRQLPEDKDIEIVFQSLYGRIKEFQKAFKHFKPGSIHNNPRERTRTLLRLCKLKNEIQNNFVKSEDSSNSTAKYLNDLIDKLKIDPCYIKAEYVLCKPEWTTGSPAEHADSHIAETWSNFGGDPKPISKSAVKSARLRSEKGK